MKLRPGWYVFDRNRDPADPEHVIAGPMSATKANAEMGRWAGAVDAFVVHVQPPRYDVVELRRRISETSDVIDPQGENDDVSLLAGLLSYSLEFDVAEWDRETVEAAIRWAWEDDVDYAEDVVARFAETVPS